MMAPMNFSGTFRFIDNKELMGESIFAPWKKLLLYPGLSLVYDCRVYRTLLN
jgi:hypothetical protein